MESDRYPFECFSDIFSHTVTVNWPYDITDAVCTAGCDGELELSPVFEKHVRKLHNWTVAREFDSAFGEMVPLVSSQA